MPVSIEPCGSVFANQPFVLEVYKYSPTGVYTYLTGPGRTFDGEGGFSGDLSFSELDLAAGEQIAILVRCNGGTAIGDTSEFSNLATIQDMPPRIEGVSVADAGGEFIEAFAPNASGDDQLWTVPVPGGVKTVSVTFNRDDVDTDKYALTVVSRYGSPTIAAEGADITWSGDGYTATWTLDSTVTLGEWYIMLHDDDVLTPVDTQLDGDWVSPANFGDDYGNSAFPSGNGVAGGDFQFAFTVLPGDANRDGIVDLIDLGIVGDNWHGSGKTWGEGDFTGEGIVDLLDLGIVGDNWNTAYWQAGEGMAMGGGGDDDDSLASLSASVDAVFAKYDLDNPDGTQSWLSADSDVFDQFVKDLFDVLGVAI